MLDQLLEMMAQSQAGAGSQSSSSAQDPLGGLLEGFLGGGAQEAGGAGDMGDLLEAVMGGMAGGQGAGSGGAMGGLLEALIGGMGGGQQGASGALGGNPMLMPFTEALAEKLGISPQMASVIISAAFMLLMNAVQKSASRGAEQPSQADLDEIMDADYLVSSGMASKVAQQTGMDEDEATKSLQEALMMLSGEAETAEEVPPQQAAGDKDELEGLDGLLESWDFD